MGVGIFPRRARIRTEPDATARMPFMEHVRELRQRLLKACLAITAGLCIGLFFAEQALDFINQPYCDRFAKQCRFTAQSPLEPFVLNLKVALYIGLLLSCPIWLYQTWAFIAPGLHKREKKWSYIFVAVAAPLFLTGAFLAYFVVARALEFLLTRNPELAVDVNLTGYFDFVTGMFLVFGVGFEFPLVVFMLNVVGVASAKKLLSWWRIAVLVIFIFTAFATPTPDPFVMTGLAIPMCVLYFVAVGAAALNDRRRARLASQDPIAQVADDEASPLPEETELEETADRARADDWPSRRNDDVP